MSGFRKYAEKYRIFVIKIKGTVAPRTGAWIETRIRRDPVVSRGRTPHGCVD